MAYKNKPYPIHFYGRVRRKCDGRLQNWPGIANERPKFLAMKPCTGMPYPWGGMKCIFSGTSIEMPGNDALRLAMISDFPMLC